MSLTIIKVGGSLFDLPDLGNRLGRLVETYKAAVLIAGGGTAADAVREWQKIHGFSDADAHETAMRSLSVTAHFLSSIVPRAELVETKVQAAESYTTGSIPVLDIAAFANENDSAFDLPRDWSVTSDSLAAWLAKLWDAERLVLCKSVDADQLSRRQLVSHALVDAGFEKVNFPGKIVWNNLRAC